MLRASEIERIREDFPIFKNTDKVYLDSAATTYKPQRVIDRIMHYYTHESVNVGRADYLVAFNVEKNINDVRAQVAHFINADADEIIFTSGASDSLNIVANAYGRHNLKKGDVILTSQAEHASNILPWFHVAEEVGAIIEYVSLNDNGELLLEDFKDAMHDKVKIVTLAAVTNVLGNIVPMKELTKVAHSYGAIVVCDAAQSVPHMPTDVKDLGVDFLAFSAHKVLAPTGVGVLYGKYELLDDMPPYKYGGGSNSRYNKAGDISFKKPPFKFETGTLPIEGILGFGEAIQYIENIGIKNIYEYEKELVSYMVSEMRQLDNVVLYNDSPDAGIVIFNVKGIFSQDVSTYLDTQGILVRSGHHCSKMINNVIDAEDTVRASIYFYNTKDDIDKFIDALKTTTIENCINLFV